MAKESIRWGGLPRWENPGSKKRRRRYGGKTSDFPYPEDFKNRMIALFPESYRLKMALDEGCERVELWFGQLYFHPTIEIPEVLVYLKQEGGPSKLEEYCESEMGHLEKLTALHGEWQRIIYLDDLTGKPWEEGG